MSTKNEQARETSVYIQIALLVLMLWSSGIGGGTESRSGPEAAAGVGPSLQERLAVAVRSDGVLFLVPLDQRPAGTLRP